MIWETLTNRFAVSTSIQKDANSWDFFELNFSPTIYPPIVAQMIEVPQHQHDK